MTERDASGRRHLVVMSTLAVQVAWPQLMASFEEASGARVETIFGPTNGLIERLKAGERGDVAVLTKAAADDYRRSGVLTDGVDVARSWVGLAVKAGAPRPDISTTGALVAALKAARAVAYSRIGASGVYFAGLIQRLGIADVVNARAVVVPTGLTGTRIVSGEADIAIQQVSELKAVPGIDIVGPLPRELQEPTLFTAAVFAESRHPDLGRLLLAHLTSADAKPVLAASGLEPV